MNMLFYDDNGKGYTSIDILNALKHIEVQRCETLFIHSDIVFGNPALGFGRKQYLDALYASIMELNVKNIIVPTFTYSFCNHEDFDVINSRTSMGAFSEYIRKKEGRYRTLDPLLSFSVPDSLKSAFENLGRHSLGRNSGFDILNKMKNVKFLFFGAKQSESFTFLHYVEKCLDVPYRYDQGFSGNIIDYNGVKHDSFQMIHTHCYGVKIPERYDYFEEELYNRGIVKRTIVGNRTISCIDKDDAYAEIANKIKTDPFYFVEGKYTEKDLVHKYSFGKNGERVTHC